MRELEDMISDVRGFQHLKPEMFKEMRRKMLIRVFELLGMRDVSSHTTRQGAMYLIVRFANNQKASAAHAFFERRSERTEEGDAVHAAIHKAFLTAINEFEQTERFPRDLANAIAPRRGFVVEWPFLERASKKHDVPTARPKKVSFKASAVLGVPKPPKSQQQLEEETWRVDEQPIAPAKKWTDMTYLQTERQSLANCEQQLQSLQREEALLKGELQRVTAEHQRVVSHIQRVRRDIAFHSNEIQHVKERAVQHPAAA